MDPSLSSSTPMDPLNTTDSSPCMLRLSSLASITSVRSDHLPSWSLWRRCCSLGVALSSCSRCNLSLISVELHGEESFVAQKFQHVCKFEMHVYLRFRSFNLNFRYMASCTYADRHTHMSCNVVNYYQPKYCCNVQWSPSPSFPCPTCSLPLSVDLSLTSLSLNCSCSTLSFNHYMIFRSIVPPSETGLARYLLLCLAPWRWPHSWACTPHPTGRRRHRQSKFPDPRWQQFPLHLIQTLYQVPPRFL